MSSTLIVVGILLFLIVIHELGHFLAAKWSGVQVDEFGIGYPPRIFSFGKWGETLLTLNWLPFGGFVKLYGEDSLDGVPAGKKSRSLMGASRTRQAAILLAGVTGNLVAAYLLFTVALMLGTPMSVADGTTGARVTVQAVLPGSPADTAGLRSGDTIEQISSGTSVADYTQKGISDFIAQRGGSEVTIRIERTEKDEGGKVQLLRKDIVATPAHGVLTDASSRPALGISMDSLVLEKQGFLDAAYTAIPHTWHALLATAEGLWSFFKKAVTGNADMKDVVGPIGLVNIVDEASVYGWGKILALAAFISLNLVIINLLPFPALDGGRLAILAVETLARRPLPEKSMVVVNGLGFVLLIVLMIVVTYHDIVSLFT
jgi:regulator of sigma E protease